MKKKIAAITVLLIIALTVTLTACTQAAATQIVTRWYNEEYSFDISLADYNTKENATEAFNGYTYDGKTFYKDFVVQSTVLESKSNELIVPLDVTGTFKMKIAVTEDAVSGADFDTEQIVYAQFDKKTVTALTGWDDIKGCEVTGEENPFEDNNDRVTLKSTTVTHVKFENNVSQKPIESTYEIDGYFLGQTKQMADKCKVVTKYDFSKGIASVKIDNAEAVENKIPTNQTVIDSNQILLYLRSLDKSDKGFQSTPSVIVYAARTNQLSTATFMKRSGNAMLSKGNNEYIYSKLDLVSVAIGANTFMLQENLPVLENVDKVPNKIETTNKFTTVRFRVGYLAFEVVDFYDEAIENALNTYTNGKK